MNLFSILLYFLFFLASNINAEEIRLDLGNGPLSNIPILDQEDKGICYSFTAVQIIDSFRSTFDKDFNNEHLTSSEMLAVDASKNEIDKGNKRERVDGMAGWTPLLYANAFKSCDSKVIQQKYEGKTIGEYFNLLKGNFEKIKKIGPVQLSDNRLKDKIEDLLQCTNHINELTGLSLAASSIYEFVTKQENHIEPLAKVFERICEGNKIDLNLPNVKVFSRRKFNLGFLNQESEKVNNLTSVIERFLKNHSQPVAIAYCSKMLKEDDSYIGIKNKGFSNGCGGHASVVIGVREKNGQKEFLIRNSWGTNACNNYHESKRGQGQCENGQVWISQNNLENNTSYIYHLDVEAHKRRNS